MVNIISLVGKIAKDLEISEIENSKKILTLVVEVPRTYKNTNGEYGTDLIPVRITDGSMLEATKQYCLKGDLIGVKGRLEKQENEELKVIAEKVSFLASRRKEEKQ